MKQFLASILTGCFLCFQVQPGVAAQSATPPGMVLVPGGIPKPLYKLAEKQKPKKIPPFFLDIRPVSNLDFLRFIQQRPRWRRSQVPGVFAEKKGYLSKWAGDTTLGKTPPNSPVTNVSWFAARAYCQAKGKSLPTTNQWELAASAGVRQIDGSKEPGYYQRILDWYSKPATSAPMSLKGAMKNVYGLIGMHGLIWEWVEDFNSNSVTGESRGDSGLDRDLFCGSEALRASDFRDYAGFMRFAYRSSLKGKYTGNSLGFRCALPTQPLNKK